MSIWLHKISLSKPNQAVLLYLLLANSYTRLLRFLLWTFSGRCNVLIMAICHYDMNEIRLNV